MVTATPGIVGQPTEEDPRGTHPHDSPAAAARLLYGRFNNAGTGTNWELNTQKTLKESFPDNWRLKMSMTRQEEEELK